MNSLQNYMLFSSDRGGMRIEYAKQKMGELNPRDAGLLNSMPNNCNNLANNCTNSSASQNHQIANSIAHGALAHHLNNVPYSTASTVANNHVANNNHVAHSHSTKQIASQQANQQAMVNSLNNNLNAANVSIVNCNSPAGQQLTGGGGGQANSVVLVSGQESNVNGGAITITPIMSSTVEQMEIVAGLEQCQYVR